MRFEFNLSFLKLVAATALCLVTTGPTDWARASAASIGPQKSSRTRTRRTATPQSKKSSSEKAQQGGADASQSASSVTVRWRGQPGVDRYRLQVASDEGFSDIVFDQAVSGRQHVVNLPPGNYYWRVAPAVGETGSYSTPQPVEITTTATVADEKSVLVAQGTGGWRTATGELPRPVAVKLRGGRGLDLVGVNTDGTVFAIDGTNGVALWTARFNPSARRGEVSGAQGALFSPLSLVGGDGVTQVVIAFEGGLRVLGGETGRELWRATFAGRATAGVVADADGDGKPEIIAVTAEPAALLVINAETGRVNTNTKLDARVVGAPALQVRGEDRLVVLGLDDGTIETRRAGGERVNSVKLETGVTTAPLVVPTARDLVVVVGTENGLAALSAADLKQLGKIETGQDTPHGRLIAADVDGDGSAEVVMVTRRGRVALIGTGDGLIKWVAEGARDADSAALADLNGDGVLDVIAAAGPSFAHGFSGKDGSLIWKVEEETGGRTQQASSEARPRTLVIAISPSEDAFLVGGDPARVGLRAVELPKGAVKTAEK